MYMGILVALFFAPSHVADFVRMSNREPHLSTAQPLTRDALPVTVYIRAAATRYGVPEELVTAVIAVESEFNPRAVSRRGATGLMQLMPATAATFGVLDRLDAPQNIDGGVRHLRALMDRFANNLPLVLAAYNAGERPVAVYGGIPPYPETRRFVELVAGLPAELTIVLVEHDLEVVFGVATHLSVLHLGRLLADGDPDEVRADPAVRRAYFGAERAP